jgi:hypothetical protein
MRLCAFLPEHTHLTNTLLVVLKAASPVDVARHAHKCCMNFCRALRQHSTSMHVYCTA